MKAVVFDWDLTLWNSWDIHLWLMRRTAQALGMAEPEDSAIAAQHSRPFLQHLAWFFPGNQQKAEEIYLESYRGAVLEMAGLYPGVPEALVTLKRKGYQLAVLSDKREFFGSSELSQAGIGELLDYTRFLADGQHYKPDPQGLYETMEALMVSPEETVYVGDSRQDIECAHRAGAKSGAALWATVDREAVLALQPHYRWERLEQMLKSFPAHSS